MTYLLWTSVGALKSQSGKKLPGREVPVVFKKKKKNQGCSFSPPTSNQKPVKQYTSASNNTLKKYITLSSVERKCTTPCCRAEFSACSYRSLSIYTAQSYSVNGHNYVWLNDWCGFLWPHSVWNFLQQILNKLRQTCLELFCLPLPSQFSLLAFPHRY